MAQRPQSLDTFEEFPRNDRRNIDGNPILAVPPLCLRANPQCGCAFTPPALRLDRIVTVAIGSASIVFITKKAFR